MSRPYARLAAACAFAVALTASTGTALAGTARGNDNAPPVTPPALPPVQVAPSTQSSPTVPVAKSAVDVLGAQSKLLPRRPLPGVLDGATLPFTGFPTWLAAAIGFALVLAGAALRRWGRANRVSTTG
jgi:hypothetical protein